MKKQARILAFVVCLAMAVILPAASGSAAPAAIKITYAAPVQVETPMYRAAEEFKKAVEKKTDGRVQIELVFGGVLGGDRELVDAHMLGEIEMVSTSDMGFSTVIPEIAFTNMPFLFPSYDDVDKHYFNGFLGEKVKAILLGKGIRVLGWGENDYRGMSTNVPLEKLSNLSGMKLRVPELRPLLDYFSSLGANPTPMAFTEVMTSLQQGTIDGQDNGPILTYTNKFYEVQKYFTRTNHIYAGGFITINEKFFQGLPADIQKIFTEEGDRCGWLFVKWNREDATRCLDEMKKAGLTINELTPELVDAFKKAAASNWEKFRGNYNPEVMDYIFSKIVAK